MRAKGRILADRLRPTGGLMLYLYSIHYIYTYIYVLNIYVDTGEYRGELTKPKTGAGTIDFPLFNPEVWIYPPVRCCELHIRAKSIEQLWNHLG